MMGHLVLPGILVVLLAATGIPTRAAVLESGDGVRLELTAQGRVTALRIGETKLPLVAPGGFGIADFQHQPEPVNLVPNPGFEEGTRGWRLASGQFLDAQISHSGKNSVRLEVPGPQPESSNLEVMVPVKPNKRYRVGLWVRRAGVGVCGAYSSERNDRNQLTGKQSQTGPSVPKKDKTWLPLRWEITTQPQTTRLSLRANIYRSTGTLWLDDFFVEEFNEGVFDAVSGLTKNSGKDTVLVASLPERGLALEATFRADTQSLRVDGMVQDTTGRDRAVAVKFALPLNLAGWQWYHDAEEGDKIEAGPTYRLTYRCLSGIGVCSIYPWSAVAGPAAGLSVALPLEQGPRSFVIQHDQCLPELSLTFYFGLARDAGNHPSRAPFSFIIYRHEPAWGMRSAMERYYRLFPRSFVKRPPFEGYLNYANLERFDPDRHQLVISRERIDDASDFGEGYRFLWHLHGCYDYRQVPYEDRTLPSDATVFSLLRGMVEVEKTKPRSYAPTAETLKKLVYGPKQEISYIGDTRYWKPHEGYNHTDKPGWGFNFRVNEDPGISPVLADEARRRAEQYAKTPNRRPWDATFTADAIEGYFAHTGGMDYRREHFRTTQVPLTFGHGNLLPAQPNTIWDFHHKVWWPLTERYQIVTHGNANGYEQFFTMPFVDVPMTEGGWDPEHPGRLDRFMRAINHHKIWRYWHAWDRRGGYGDKDPDNVRAHFQRGLAYAIFPAVYCIQGTPSGVEPYRPLYRQYVPAIEELSKAGWEPVPHAVASEGAIVERFGSFEQGELHFTLRNYSSKPVQSKLTPNRQRLGIPADAQLVYLDILSGTPLLSAFSRDGCGMDLEAMGSRAVWLGTRQQAAQHAFRMAAATLEKLERSFAAEMNDKSRAVWARTLQAARTGEQASGDRALALAEDLQGLATTLQTELTTRSPVDLAKLLFRLRAQVSQAPVALLSLHSEVPRLVTNATRGKMAAADWKLRADSANLAGLQTRILSPWPESARACRVTPEVRNLVKGQQLTCQAGLAVPVDPPRRLLPYLLEVTGTAGPDRFTVAVPVDVQLEFAP
jgi:hypothetical protein